MLIDHDKDQDNHTGEQTHFHTGEITAVSPSKPATSGALVNVHVLQVYIHTNNTPAEREREREGEEGGNEEKWKEKKGQEERGK